MTSDIAGASRRAFLAVGAAGLVGPVAARRSDQGSGPSNETGPAAPPAAGEVVSVRSFGAIGDGFFHPVSERFPTLADARKRLPTAAGLDASLDGAAIQAAIDEAEARGRRSQATATVHVPAGRYRLSESLRLPANVALVGDGANQSFIDNQNTELRAPLVVNKEPDFAAMALRGLSLHGGTHGVRLDVSGYVERCTFEDVSFQLQRDKNLQCNKLLQQARFDRCTFGRAPYGLFVGAWTSNVLSFLDCSFEDHDRAHLTLRAAECVNVVGGRFEGGGDPAGGHATIDLEAAAAVNFIGVYFENTHPLLIRDARSRHGVHFAGCHFTGARGADGFVPYRFESDGVMSFGPNDWGRVCIGPARIALSGPNAGLSGNSRVYLTRTASRCRIASERVAAPAASRRPVAVFRRPPMGDGTASVSATLAVEYRAASADGRPVLVERTFKVLVDFRTEGPPLIAMGPTPEATAMGAPLDHFALHAAAGPSGEARIDVAVDPGRSFSKPGLRWTLDATMTADDPAALLMVDLD